MRSTPYARGDEAKVIDIGGQPSGLSTAVPIESLLRDRILQRQLAAEGWTLRVHGYQTGKDMLPYADGRLDILLLGDIPALTLMAQRNFGMFALARLSTNALIGKRLAHASGAKGVARCLSARHQRPFHPAPGPARRPPEHGRHRPGRHATHGHGSGPARRHGGCGCRLGAL
jgi:hypothetical protein